MRTMTMPNKVILYAAGRPHFCFVNFTISSAQNLAILSNSFDILNFQHFKHGCSFLTFIFIFSSLIDARR